MLVEDDTGHAFLVCRAFEPLRAEFELTVTVTLAEAQVWLKKSEFDLVIADLRLPDMDGTEVIKLVKKKQPKTEVIAITGYGSISSAVETMKAGATEYLPKPFTEEEFMTKVDLFRYMLLFVSSDRRLRG